MSGNDPTLWICLGALLPAVIGIVLANGKGKSPVLWGLLCFAFGFIAVIVLALKRGEPRTA